MKFYKYIFLIFLSFNFVLSCPVCYGNATGPTIDGVNAAIFTMLVITGFIFTGIIAFVVMLKKKNKSF